MGDDEHTGARLPRIVRTAVILAAAGALWSALICGIAVLSGRVRF
jgi:hypothetical protein